MTAPQLHVIGSFRFVEGLQGGSEVVALSSDQIDGGAVEPLDQGYLEQEVDPQLADVVDRRVQPYLQNVCALASDPVDESSGSGISLLGPDRCGEVVLDQTVECSIDQGSTDRDDTSDHSVGVELAGDGEAMRILLSEDSQHRILGGRELWHRRGSHNVTINGLVVTSRVRRGLLVVISLLIVSCAADQEASDEVLVSAAASLTDLFSEMENAYEDEHPGVDVVVNFGGSSALREQILEGAPVDVFASADLANMETLVETELVDGQPQVFANNQMQIAVPPGNPGEVAGVSDFSDVALLVGLCASEVPCGRLAREVLAGAGVVPEIDSNEPDVRALLTKIELGELDLGMVYVTDVVASAGSVEGIPIPSEANVTTDYPIAVLSDGPNQVQAEEFVTWVTSDEGRAIIADHGFGLP